MVNELIRMYVYHMDMANQYLNEWVDVQDEAYNLMNQHWIIARSLEKEIMIYC